MPDSLYKYIWSVNPRGQVLLIVLTALVFPLSMAPLELQRRIVNDAIQGVDVDLLLLLGGGYLAYMVVHGGLKFLMNMQLARIIQQATAHLREGIYYCIYGVVPARNWRREQGQSVDQGTVVSMLASEAEKLGQFVGGSFSTPVLQGGTIITILGYMIWVEIWVEPLVAVIGLAVYAPQMVIVALMQRRIDANNRTYSERVRKLGDFVVDNADTAEQTKEVPAGFTEIVKQMVEAKMAAVRLKLVLKFLRNFINHLGPLGILVGGGWLVIRGDTELGTVVAFLSGFERLSGPWNELIAFYRQLANAHMKYAMLVDAFPRMPEDAATPPRPGTA